MVNTGRMYTQIDVERTGRRMKRMIQQSGYTVREIQKMLHLSYPQPIYRWFNGNILPSVDHLYMLSRILGVHMEDFLVHYLQKEDIQIFLERSRESMHLEEYYVHLCRSAA